MPTRRPRLQWRLHAQHELSPLGRQDHILLNEGRAVCLGERCAVPMLCIMLATVRPHMARSLQTSMSDCNALEDKGCRW